MARFIGITCHAFPEVLKTALERHEFDCTPDGAERRPARPGQGFAAVLRTVALPVALRKKMGVTAMKIFAQDVLVGQASHDKLIRYSMSLPVAAAVIGMPKVEHIEATWRSPRHSKPLPGEEMKKMSGELAPRKPGRHRHLLPESRGRVDRRSGAHLRTAGAALDGDSGGGEGGLHFGGPQPGGIVLDH